MANTKVTGDLIAGGTITTFNLADGSVTAAKLNSITTDHISEGTNLFYTDARVSTYLSSNNYITSTAIANSANWDEAYSWGDHALAGYLTTNAVDSVNAQTGVVVLDADDIDDTATTNKFTTQADIDKLAGIEALADVTDATNVAAAGALMSGTAQLSDLVDVASTTPTDGQVLTYDTTNGWQPEDSQGGSYIIEEISTNTTAQAEYLYVLTASLTLTLPASPNVGDKVALSNLSGTTTPVVARNGNLIAGLAEDVTIDVENLSVEFIYSGANQGWIIFVDAILGTAPGGSAIDGSGTTNYLSKWVDANTLTDSVIYESSGNIGIGTNTITNGTAFGGSNQVNKLKVESAGAPCIQINTTTSLGGSLQFTSSNVTQGFVSFSLFNSENTLGIVNKIAGPVVFYTNDTERMRILAGGGLTFNGDTAAANALDDYEEGTWTPSLLADSGSATYTTQDGSYVKIGRQVTCTFHIRVNVSSSLVSENIEGLPFTSAASGTNYAGVSFSAYNVGAFNGFCNILGLVPQNSTLVVLRTTTSATQAPGAGAINITNSSLIAGSFTYFV
jgi:hypothetical protein